MPPNSVPTHNNPKNRNVTQELSEPCKLSKTTCNAQRPCIQCIKANPLCNVMISEYHHLNVFPTHTARRLSSGSACDTCRKRKTKCDGKSPCGFCAHNRIECINHHSEKKNSKPLKQQPTSVEAFDRIENSLRRIEELMTVFSPSPLSSLDIRARPHRHSIHNTNILRDSSETTMHVRRRGTSSGSIQSTPIMTTSRSMMNLSPYTNSSNSTLQGDFLSQPISIMANDRQDVLMGSPEQTLEDFNHDPSVVSHTKNFLKTSKNNELHSNASHIPSVMDQLSNITFVHSTNDFTFTNYPIYPLTPSSSKPNSYSS